MIARIFNWLLCLAVIAGGAAYFLVEARKPPAPAQTAKADAAKDEGKDQAKAEIHMSADQARAAGIEIARAGAATIRESLQVNGIVSANGETLVQVTPRFAGLVRAVARRVGDKVAKGDLLASVESNTSLTTYELRAPFAGTVIDRQAVLGEYASEQKAMFTIADLGTVWVDLTVYRRDLGRLALGDTLTLDVEDGKPPIATRIDYVSPVGNADTQSGLARAVVPNGEGRLRPGLFVTATVALKPKAAHVAISTNALQTVEQRPVVFVRTDDGFLARPVETGRSDGAITEILSGLEAGESYAAKNSFVAKAELAKGSAHDDD